MICEVHNGTDAITIILNPEDEDELALVDALKSGAAIDEIVLNVQGVPGYSFSTKRTEQ